MEDHEKQIQHRMAQAKEMVEVVKEILADLRKLLSIEQNAVSESKSAESEHTEHSDVGGLEGRGSAGRDSDESSIEKSKPEQSSLKKNADVKVLKDIDLETKKPVVKKLKEEMPKSKKQNLSLEERLSMVGEFH
jgi:hypothetical protein